MANERSIADNWYKTTLANNILIEVIFARSLMWLSIVVLWRKSSMSTNPIAKVDDGCILSINFIYSWHSIAWLWYTMCQHSKFIVRIANIPVAPIPMPDVRTIWHKTFEFSPIINRVYAAHCWVCRNGGEWRVRRKRRRRRRESLWKRSGGNNTFECCVPHSTTKLPATTPSFISTEWDTLLSYAAVPFGVGQMAHKWMLELIYVFLATLLPLISIPFLWCSTSDFAFSPSFFRSLSCCCSQLGLADMPTADYNFHLEVGMLNCVCVHKVTILSILFHFMSEK